VENFPLLVLAQAVQTWLRRRPGFLFRNAGRRTPRRRAGRAPSNGIFFDQGTSETRTERNVLWNIAKTPLGFHWTFGGRVAGNTFFLRPGQKIAAYNRAAPKDVAFENNRTQEAANRSGDLAPELAKSIIEAAGPTSTHPAGR